MKNKLMLAAALLTLLIGGMWMLLTDPPDVQPESAVVPPTPAKPAAGTAQLYKCQKDGVVTFSDTPCGENGEVINMPEAAVIDNSVLREKAKEWAKQDAAVKPREPVAIRIPDSTTGPIGNNTTVGVESNCPEGVEPPCDNSTQQQAIQKLETLMNELKEKN